MATKGNRNNKLPKIYNEAIYRERFDLISPQIKCRFRVNLPASCLV
jgi:hypothetical protein